jgi:hypothetical protein
MTTVTIIPASLLVILTYNFGPLAKYLGSLIKDLSWPQVFLIFVLIFPRQCRGLLSSISDLIERIKTLQWGGLQGQIGDVATTVEIARTSEAKAEESVSEAITETASKRIANALDDQEEIIDKEVMLHTSQSSYHHA